MHIFGTKKRENKGLNFKKLSRAKKLQNKGLKILISNMRIFEAKKKTWK